MPIIDQSTPEYIKLVINEKSLQGEPSMELKQLCKERLAEQVRDIRFDMAEVRYMDSASIGTLLYIIQVLKKDDKKVMIETASDELRQLLKSLLLDQFLVFPGAKPPA